MKMVLIGCVVCLAAATAWGAADPGPAIGAHVDRSYDDGFVLIDISGNNGDYTWYWGYENFSQVNGDTLRFHSVTYTGLVATVLTDTYDLGGISPPQAPYQGTFAGPGPLILAEPSVRSVVNTNLPPVAFTPLSTNLLLQWQGFTNGIVEAAESITPPVVWTPLTNRASVVSNQTQVTIFKSAGSKFYRVRFLP